MANRKDPMKGILEQMQKVSLTDQPNKGLNISDGPKEPVPKPKTYYRCEYCNELHELSSDDSDEMTDS